MAAGYWLLVAGCWLLTVAAAGCLLFVAGCWLLAVDDCLLFADKTRVPLVKRVYALGMKDGTGG